MPKPDKSNPYPPLPIAALSDLYGITRALYRATDASDEERVQRLEGIGKTLRAVLRARGEHPGTIQHLEAWQAAEWAAKELVALVSGSPELARIVGATARLVKRDGGAMVSGPLPRR